MKVVDANVLLYAVNADTLHHEASRQWLDAALSVSATVGFTWMAITAFVRISTKVGIFPTPLTPGQAVDQVRSWLDAPGARVLEPTGQHLTVLERLLAEVGTGGISSVTPTWPQSPSNIAQTSSRSMTTSVGSQVCAGTARVP